MEYLRFVFACIFIFIGVFISLTGMIGFYKYKYILNRMHSSALVDTLGLFFVLFGLMIAKGFTDEAGNFDVTSIKLICVLVFLWLTSPVSSHLIAKIIYLTDMQAEKETKEIELEVEQKEEKE